VPGAPPEEPQAISGEIDAPVTDAEASAIAEKAKRPCWISWLDGIKAAVETLSDAKSGETILEIRSDNSGLLIGRKGQTLEALHYLTRIAGERPGTMVPIWWSMSRITANAAASPSKTWRCA
jgi:predicted RNA-binding protein YlqC (UPF0109 family)